jgi:hypothetical protein
MNESRAESREPGAKPENLAAGDVALLRAAEAAARRRMQSPASESPTREEIEAEIRARANAVDFARNHRAA